MTLIEELRVIDKYICLTALTHYSQTLCSFTEFTTKILVKQFQLNHEVTVILNTVFLTLEKNSSMARYTH